MIGASPSSEYVSDSTCTISRVGSAALPTSSDGFDACDSNRNGFADDALLSADPATRGNRYTPPAPSPGLLQLCNSLGARVSERVNEVLGTKPFSPTSELYRASTDATVPQLTDMYVLSVTPGRSDCTDTHEPLFSAKVPLLVQSASDVPTCSITVPFPTHVAAAKNSPDDNPVTSR